MELLHGSGNTSPSAFAAPLGNTAKSSSAGNAQRRDRFILQGAAALALPEKRVSKCLRLRQRHCHAEIWHSSEHGKAHYKGLQSCCSVWDCPVCGARITEVRASEMKAIRILHRAAGGDTALLTLTTPHYLGDDLKGLLACQAQALRLFLGSRSFASLRRSLGLVGSVRVLEVTYGVNGWHPHYHILLFFSAGHDLDRLRIEFFGLWLKACLSAGLPAPSLKHGVSLDGADGVDKALEDYLTKGLEAGRDIGKKAWTVEQEMTKGHVKRGRAGSSTPRDILRASAAGDSQATALFREYSYAFHGKRQLFYSPGLKDRYGILSREDSEIVESGTEDAQLGCVLTDQQWQLVLQHQKRAEILEAFEAAGVYGVSSVLASLRGVSC